MTELRDLPPGWASARIGDLGEIMLGRQRAPKWHQGPNMRPYLRVKNVFEDRIDLSDVKEMDFPPGDYEKYKLEPGDVLLNEGQSPELVGRPAMYRGELPGACFTNSLIRFRPYDGVDGRYALFGFRWLLHSGRFQREARITTNIAHLSSKRFASVEFPVAPTAEQERIVAAIEEHFSRLDAAEASIGTALAKLRRLATALLEVATSGDWPTMQLDELLLSLRNGCFVSRPHAKPPGQAIFRISAVRPLRLNTDDVRYAPLSLPNAEDYRVMAGDLLFTRYSGNPAYVGACVVVPERGAGVLHPDKLIRGVVDRAKAAPEWIALAVSSAVGRVEIEKRLKTTAGQVGIAGGQLKSVPIPVPPLDTQARRVEGWQEASDRVARTSAALLAHSQRAGVLRRAIFRAAFAGQLVSQDPADEPASDLLERMGTPRKQPVRRARAAS